MTTTPQDTTATVPHAAVAAEEGTIDVTVSEVAWHRRTFTVAELAELLDVDPTRDAVFAALDARNSEHGTADQDDPALLNRMVDPDRHDVDREYDEREWGFGCSWRPDRPAIDPAERPKRAIAEAVKALYPQVAYILLRTTEEDDGYWLDLGRINLTLADGTTAVLNAGDVDPHDLSGLDEYLRDLTELIGPLGWAHTESITVPNTSAGEPADWVDTGSSASRQHCSDTGRYLTRHEAQQTV